MHPHPNTSSFEYSSFSEGLALISANLKYVAVIFCALRITSRQCCGSGMFIPDPDFYPSRISDPGSKNSYKRERWKKKFCHTIFWSHKFHKIENYFFEMLKKIIWANFQRIIEFFTQKIVNKLSKIWVLDPGSGKKTFPDPGSRGQKGTESRIQIRNTASRPFLCFCVEDKLKISALGWRFKDSLPENCPPI